MNILRCLLFAGAVTLVFALGMRTTTMLEEETNNNYAVEWLLLGLALGGGLLLHAERRGATM